MVLLTIVFLILLITYGFRPNEFTELEKSQAVLLIPILILGFALIILSLLINSSILKNLALIFNRSEPLPLIKAKRKTFNSIKLIVVSYFLDFAFIIYNHTYSLDYIKSIANVKSTEIVGQSQTDLAFLISANLIPVFSGPLSLVIAIALFYYIKDQELIEKMKQESDLVI